jgi:hypothetical protein
MKESLSLSQKLSIDFNTHDIALIKLTQSPEASLKLHIITFKDQRLSIEASPIN